MLDSRFSDEDPDDVSLISSISDDEDDMSIDITEAQTTSYTTENYQQRAANIYKLYLTQYKTRFKWIRSDLSLPFL